MELGFNGLVAGRQIEGDPALHGIAGVDVLEPRTVLAAGAPEVDVC